jgi:hypothetical protein
MKVEDYRNEVTARLVKLDERQISIFKALQRIDKHLNKLNGKVERHGVDIERIKTYGSFAVLIIPIVVSIVLRLISKKYVQSTDTKLDDIWYAQLEKSMKK